MGHDTLFPAVTWDAGSCFSNVHRTRFIRHVYGRVSPGISRSWCWFVDSSRHLIISFLFLIDEHP